MPTPHSAVPPAGSTDCPELSALWTARHNLPADVVRSLADIWTCGSAARMPEIEPDRFWDDDPDFYARHDTAACSWSRPTHPATDQPMLDPYVAVEHLFTRRHRLTTGELFAIQHVWCCASAAQWGGPHERFWEDFAELLADHDIAECEDPEQLAPCGCAPDDHTCTKP